MNENMIKNLGTIGGIFPIIPIIAWFIGGKDLTGNARNTLKTITNLCICVILVNFVLGFIPIINLLTILIWLGCAVFSIKAFLGLKKDEVFTLPFPIIEIVK